MAVKPFKFKKTRKYPPSPEGGVKNPLPPAGEVYTGTIDGYKASQGEENLLRGAYKTGLVVGHLFRMAVGAPRNKPGWKELDFLFQTSGGQYVAVQIRDFDFVHHGPIAEAGDIYNDAYILQNLKNMGFEPKGNRIYTVDDNSVATIDTAKQAAQEILL
jgi:hypothetical protein